MEKIEFEIAMQVFNDILSKTVKNGSKLNEVKK